VARQPATLWTELKKLKDGENRFSVRIGAHHRAIGHIFGNTVEWVWIGTHEDYNKLLS
jgi:hypothetical protein